MEATRKHLAHLAYVPLVALSLAGAHAAGQSVQQPQQDSSGHDASSLSRQEARNYEGVRASQLIGTRVSDSQGHTLGKIDDLVIHMSTGDVRYAILARRVADSNESDERLYAVPLDRFSSTDKGQLKLQVRPDELGDQRWWRKDKWPGLQDSAFWGEIDRLSGLPAVQPSEQYYAHRVSDLIGKDVVNPQGEDLGTVRDLVIDLGHDQVHYAILDFQGAGAQAQNRYAVPITAFMFPRGGEDHSLRTDRLVLNVNADKVGQMHSFNDNNWPDFGNPSRVAQVDRYLILFFPENQAAATGSTQSGTQGSSMAGGSGSTRGGTDMNALFDRIDLNRDGNIDTTEYSQFQQMHARAMSQGQDEGGVAGGTAGSALSGSRGSGRQ